MGGVALDRAVFAAGRLEEPGDAIPAREPARAGRDARWLRLARARPLAGERRRRRLRADRPAAVQHARSRRRLPRAHAGRVGAVHAQTQDRERRRLAAVARRAAPDRRAGRARLRCRRARARPHALARRARAAGEGRAGRWRLDVRARAQGRLRSRGRGGARLAARARLPRGRGESLADRADPGAGVGRARGRRPRISCATAGRSSARGAATSSCVDGAFDDAARARRFTLFASGLHEPLGAAVRDRRGSAAAAVRSTCRRAARRAHAARRRATATTAATSTRPCATRGASAATTTSSPSGPSSTATARCGSRSTSASARAARQVDRPVARLGARCASRPTASMHPVCGGLRSPDGIGAARTATMFYTDNQGDWVGHQQALAAGARRASTAIRRACRCARGAAARRPRGDGVPAAARSTGPPCGSPTTRWGERPRDFVLDATGGASGPSTARCSSATSTHATVMRVVLERVDGRLRRAPASRSSTGSTRASTASRWRATARCFVGDDQPRLGLDRPAAPRPAARRLRPAARPSRSSRCARAPDGFELEFTAAHRRGERDPSSYSARRATPTCTTRAYGSDEIDRAEPRPPRRAR